MKEKSLLKMLLIAIFAIMSVGFVACGSDDEADDEPTLKFTKAMIAGDFSSYVENYTIERGSSSKLAKGVYLKFNNDGTCSCFHRMETAYRLNNGRIETYYAQTSEPMFVYTLLSQSGDVLKVRMTGTLDDDLSATLTLKKTSKN